MSVFLGVLLFLAGLAIAKQNQRIKGQQAHIRRLKSILRHTAPAKRVGCFMS